MLRQEMEETLDQPRQICRDKDFNVAINRLASGKKQRRLGHDNEKVYRDNK